MTIQWLEKFVPQKVTVIDSSQRQMRLVNSSGIIGRWS